MIHAPGAEVDGELNGARLRRLIGVQSKREIRLPTRREVPPGLISAERPLLDEHVGGPANGAAAGTTSPRTKSR